MGEVLRFGMTHGMDYRLLVIMIIVNLRFHKSHLENLSFCCTQSLHRLFSTSTSRKIHLYGNGVKQVHIHLSQCTEWFWKEERPTLWHYNEIWQAKVPPSVKIFGYFVIKNKVLTRDVLERRHIFCNVNCSMCRDQKVTCLFSCQCALSVWNYMQNSIKKRILVRRLVQGMSLPDIWDQSWREVKQKGNMPKGEWLNHVLCTFWWIWWQKNEGRSIWGKDSTRESTMV